MQDFRRRQGRDNRPNNRGGSDRRFGADRRRPHQSNDRNNLQNNRNRNRSGNSDRDKMPPPKAPQRRGGGGLAGVDRRRRIRNDTKTSLVHKRLAEKHTRRDRAREVINKRIKMAKMRSTLNQRRRTTGATKLGGGAGGNGRRLPLIRKTASKVTGKRKLGTSSSEGVVAKNKKVSESADKDTADETWDDDEKQIHEEEMAAKKAAEALHESNSGDDATKKSQVIKINRERTESASEKDTAKKVATSTQEPHKRLPINLTCIHCKSKCQTPMEYKFHFDGMRHVQAMRKLLNQQKQQLQQMRQEQRNAQKEADESAVKDARSKHCQLCRLFYKQSKEEHQESEDHKNIKKLLMPFCHICKSSHKSPMAYEIHRATLRHLRKKAYFESIGKIPDEEETELDLDNFTTVDEVGEIDGDDAVNNDIGENNTTNNDDPQDFSDEEYYNINVGSEHIKLVEVNFCELCNMYITHRGKQDHLMKQHCTQRSHLRNYIRFKDDKELKAEAEILHKKRKAERELREKEKAAAEAAEKAKENGAKENEEEEKPIKDEEAKDKEATEEESVPNESAHTENGDLLDISIKKEKDDSFNLQEEDEGVAA